MSASSYPLETPVDLPMILNWRRLDEWLTTSGQPTETQLAEIKELGVTHIVNLGLHDHDRALDEQSSVTNLGMAYHHIPVDFAAPQQDEFIRLCDIMGTTTQERVHVHCIMNARVSAFMYRYQREVLGVPEARAYQFMETVWRPGGVWASFIGRDEETSLPNRYAGRDY